MAFATDQPHAIQRRGCEWFIQRRGDRILDRIGKSFLRGCNGLYLSCFRALLPKQNAIPVRSEYFCNTSHCHQTKMFLHKPISYHRALLVGFQECIAWLVQVNPDRKPYNVENSRALSDEWGHCSHVGVSRGKRRKRWREFDMCAVYSDAHVSRNGANTTIFAEPYYISTCKGNYRSTPDTDARASI